MRSKNVNLKKKHNHQGLIGKRKKRKIGNQELLKIKPMNDKTTLECF